MIVMPKPINEKVARYYAVFLPNDLWEYAKAQPDGASALIAKLLQGYKENQ